MLNRRDGLPWKYRHGMAKEINGRAPTRSLPGAGRQNQEAVDILADFLLEIGMDGRISLEIDPIAERISDELLPVKFPRFVF